MSRRLPFFPPNGLHPAWRVMVAGEQRAIQDNRPPWFVVVVAVAAAAAVVPLDCCSCARPISGSLACQPLARPSMGATFNYLMSSSTFSLNSQPNSAGNSQRRPGVMQIGLRFQPPSLAPVLASARGDKAESMSALATKAAPWPPNRFAAAPSTRCNGRSCLRLRAQPSGSPKQVRPCARTMADTNGGPASQFGRKIKLAASVSAPILSLG